MTKFSFNPEIYGFILGDKIGYEKTTKSLMHIILHNWIVCAVTDLEAPGTEQDGKHLPNDSVEDSLCPSNNT